MSAFTNKAVKQKTRLITIHLRKQLFEPRLLAFRKKINTSLSPSLLAEEFTELLRLSNEISCISKPSYSMEEAAYIIDFYEPTAEPYLCRHCGFVHFGHTSATMKQLQKKIYF